jgi:hypothetical protein
MEKEKMRKLISIRIDPKIYQTARELGLNISKTCENSLKQAIQRRTSADCLTNPDSPTNCMSKLIRPSQPSEITETIGEPGSPRAMSANAKREIR